VYLLPLSFVRFSLLCFRWLLCFNKCILN